MTLTANPAGVAFTGATVLTATVTGADGVPPTGPVSFSAGTSWLGATTLSRSGAGAVATFTLDGVQLAVGSNTITASYGGDAAYFGEVASASVVETTPFAGSYPSIGGVSNGASYTQAIAPGGILSIFGTQLAPATASAQGVPLPTMLAGTTVTLNGVSASLYFASPGQLNIQIPYEVSDGPLLAVDNNGETDYYIVTLAAEAPAIFTTNSQGAGQGAVLDNATYRLVDASHPATPGSTYIQIYCTGLGPVADRPADGAASPSSPLAKTSVPVQVTIGGVQENAIFSGLAPGFVGLYQVNALVPAGVTAGSAVPVVISMGGIASNSVTIAVGP
jgi:uncharacterized protein (TIGR03437 family)